jgi:tripartite-type tricarboxylate transporter receptor subunit TctC
MSDSVHRPDSVDPSRRAFTRAAALGLAAAGLAPMAARAEAGAFPSRPLRIVVPFGAGSGTDTATRQLAQLLEASLKQPVVVDNRPGANGAIAASVVAKAPADGYTLVMGTNSTHGANPGLIAKMTYDPVKDFVPIGMVALFSSFLVVHPSVPARTPAELIAYGKANPKGLSFASGNTSSLIMGEMFARRGGIEMLRVPFNSNPAGLIEVIAGRVPVMFPDIASSLAHVKAGSVRALGVVTLGGRSNFAPELPTVSETLPDFNFVGWIGLFAPAGTPEPVAQRLASEVRKIMAQPAVAQRFHQMGAEPNWMGPAEFAPFVRSEVARLPKILADIGIQPQ